MCVYREKIMPKQYGRFQFAENAEIKRRAGSDWMVDTNGKRKKLRSWDSAASEWKPTALGRAYYKHVGGSEWVVSVPCHYIIAKQDDKEVMYKGYFPVSQMKTGLKKTMRPLML